MKKTCLIFAVILNVFCALTSRADLTDAEIRHQLLAQPPQGIVKLQEKLPTTNGHPTQIKIDYYTRADLGGNGSFNYIIALFGLEDDTDGFLRVFKVQGSTLLTVGDQDDDNGAGGYNAQFDLVDVNGDGIPELLITSTSSSGQQEFFQIFYWTGSTLHNMMILTPVDEGAFIDLYGDGNLEIATNNVGGHGYDVYKPVGQSYKFVKTYLNDPTGRLDANGEFNYVRAFCKKLEPRHFSLDDVAKARSEKHPDDDDLVRLQFGGLEKVNGGPVDVNLVDPKTIRVGPQGVPVHVSIRARGDEDRDVTCAEDHKCSGSIRVDLPRSSFLKTMQQLHPYGPLSDGDKVDVKLTARLLDGTPVSAIFQASIVGDHDDKKQHDQSGDGN